MGLYRCHSSLSLRVGYLLYPWLVFDIWCFYRCVCVCVFSDYTVIFSQVPGDEPGEPVSARVTWMPASRYPCQAALTDVKNKATKPHEPIRATRYTAGESLDSQISFPSLAREWAIHRKQTIPLSCFYVSKVGDHSRVPFLKSLVWLDLGLNPGLPGHWRTL